MASSNIMLFDFATISTLSPPDKLGFVVKVILSNAVISYVFSACNTPFIKTSISPDGGNATGLPCISKTPIPPNTV